MAKNQNTGNTKAKTGKDQPLTGPQYPTDLGKGQANADPKEYVLDLLRSTGQTNYSDPTYTKYLDTLVTTMVDQYNAALAHNQTTGVVDFFQNAYGAGWDAAGNANLGTLGSQLGMGSKAYRDFWSNTNPDDFLRSTAATSGVLAPNANSDFADYYQKVFLPNQQAAFSAQAAQGAQGPATSPLASPTTTPGTTAGGTPPVTTLPVGDPLGYKDWMHQVAGINKPQNGFNQGRQDRIKQQYQDYIAPYAPGTPAGGATTPAAASPGAAANPLSLADFMQQSGHSLIDAQKGYAMRPDAQRLPSPVSGVGRWSWWA